jgi:putative transposase
MAEWRSLTCCRRAAMANFLRAVAEAVLQILMEADVEGLIGAGRHERSADRLNYRNGYRERSLDTRLGSLQLRIPSCARARTSRPFWSRARPPRRR